MKTPPRSEPSSAGVGSAAGQIGAAAAAASGAGAAIVATAAAACCATPTLAVLTVSLLGASGAAWAAGLKPYAPWFLAVSALAIAYGVRATTRATRACAVSGASARRLGDRVARVSLWIAVTLWVAALAANLFLRS